MFLVGCQLNFIFDFTKSKCGGKCNPTSKVRKVSFYLDKTTFRRPSGVAEDDVRAHLMAVKIRHRDKLKAMTKEFNKETAKLKAQVLPSRKRITETKNQIQEKKLKLASVSDSIEFNFGGNIKFIHTSLHLFY